MKAKKYSLKACLIIIATVIIFFITAFYFINNDNKKSYSNTSYAMGSFVEQTINAENAQEVAAEVISAIISAENDISTRKPESFIAKLNESAGKNPVEISNEVYNLLDFCIELSESTNGKFDPLILSLTSLWDFDNNKKIIPDNEEISKAVLNTDYNFLKLDKELPYAYIENEYAGLDLGAVGKGYGCDKAIEIYSQNNVDDAVISVGGTIGLYSAEDKKEWTVAIKDPFEAMKGNYSTIGNIRLNKGYIATSGLYEKYFNEDDTIYHHILDPDTGYPVENELMSVTVVSQTGVLSDILSTACFVMGVENSKEVLKQYNAQAVFVLKDGKIYITDGIFDDFEPAAHQYAITKLEL